MDLLLAVPVLLFAITSHEFAHAYAALRQGDYTAYQLGRVSLNPLRHIDPVGTIILPAILLLTKAGFLFGWARPVPVDPSNYRDYRRGDIIVSLAGIAANLILAVIATAVLLLLIPLGRALPGLATPIGILGAMAEYGIVINLVLALFNLIPIPPLDGSHVLYHLLPPRLGARYRELGRFGMLIVIALVVFVPGGLRILFAPVSWVMRVVWQLAGAI